MRRWTRRARPCWRSTYPVARAAVDFKKVQRALDAALAAHCMVGAPGIDVSARVRQFAAREKKQALWVAAPDLLHLGGGLAGTLLTAWLLPVPTATVIAAGLGFTLLTYLPHALFRGVIETADEL